MIRALFYAILSIFAITFIRMVVGIITKGMGDLMKEEAAGQRAASSPKRPQEPPTRGEFKPCAGCGTYVLASSAVTHADKSGTRYYCSDACRQKDAA